jgi:hypothetical protein
MKTFTKIKEQAEKSEQTTKACEKVACITFFGLSFLVLIFALQRKDKKKVVKASAVYKINTKNQYLLAWRHKRHFLQSEQHCFLKMADEKLKSILNSLKKTAEIIRQLTESTQSGEGVVTRAQRLKATSSSAGKMNFLVSQKNI